ncbi:MAG: SdrD B-like domain-containing protein [Bacteroidota bacterium]
MKNLHHLILTLFFLFPLFSFLPGQTVQFTIRKSIDGGMTSVESGSDFTYKINVTYQAPLAPGELTITDLLPTGVIHAQTIVNNAEWNTSHNGGLVTITNSTAININGSVEFKIRVRTNSGTIGNGCEFCNRAELNYPGGMINSKDACIEVTAQNKWTISKHFMYYISNTRIRYQIRLRPNGKYGNFNLYNSSIYDESEPGSTIYYLNGLPGAIDINHAPNRLELATNSTLHAFSGGYYAINLDVEYPCDQFSTGDTVCNKAKFSANGPDRCPPSVDQPPTSTAWDDFDFNEAKENIDLPDTSTCRSIVIPDANGILSKNYLDRNHSVGCENIYTVYYYNNGGIPINNITLTDDLPGEIDILNIASEGFSGMTFQREYSDDNGSTWLPASSNFTTENVSPAPTNLRWTTTSGSLLPQSSVYMLLHYRIRANSRYDNSPVNVSDVVTNTAHIKTGIVPDSIPSLTLFKTGEYDDFNDNGIVDIGDNINYDFTIFNNGNATISNIQLDDPFLGVTGPISNPTLLSGASTSESVVYPITTADISAGLVANSATVSGLAPSNVAVSDVSDNGNETVDGPDPDTDPTNDSTIVDFSGCQEIPVFGLEAEVNRTFTVEAPQGEFCLEKTVSKSFPNINDVITYKMAIYNYGGGGLTGTVTDSVPSGLTIVPGSFRYYSQKTYHSRLNSYCNNVNTNGPLSSTVPPEITSGPLVSGQLISLDINLPPACEVDSVQKLVIAFDVIVTNTVPPALSIPNHFQLNGIDSDPVNIRVNSVSEIRVEKRVKGDLDSNFNFLGNAMPGGKATFEITINNVGNQKIDSITIFDKLPMLTDTDVACFGTGSPRDSEFNLSFDGTANSGIPFSACYFQLAPNDIITAFTGCPANTPAPNDNGFKIDFGSYELNGGQSIVLTYDVDLPGNTPIDRLACNNVTFTANNANTNAPIGCQLSNTACLLARDSRLEPPTLRTPNNPCSFQPEGTIDLPQRTDLQSVVIKLKLIQNGTIIQEFTNPTVNGNNYEFFIHPNQLPTSGCFDLMAELTYKLRGFEIVQSSGTLAEGSKPGQDNDVCFGCFGKIGDLVWDDINKNGIQDNGEQGVNGVVIHLRGRDINGDPVTRQQTSNLNGNYLFDDLPPGDYKVEFILLNDRVGSPPNQGADDEKDSDIFRPNHRTETITLEAGDCLLHIDAGCYPCGNCTAAGEISGDETLCGPGNDPAPINTISLPTCPSGDIEYFWIQSTDYVPGSVDGTWTMVPDATGATYDPGLIYQTTYYRRCVRIRDCHLVKESNIVVKTVGSDAMAKVSGPTTICTNTEAAFSTPDSGRRATYRWDFGSRATVKKGRTTNPTVVWSHMGVHTAKVQVRANGCIATHELQVFVTNSPVHCD